MLQSPPLRQENNESGMRDVSMPFPNVMHRKAERGSRMFRRVKCLSSPQSGARTCVGKGYHHVKDTIEGRRKKLTWDLG